MSLEEFERSIESPALRNIVDHWLEARSGRRMPGWDDLKPQAIKEQLAIIWAWKFDRQSEEFVGRLAGERIEQVFGMSLRGKNMSEVFARHDFQMAYARHLRVVKEPVVYRGHGLVYRHMDRFDIGERVVMPLAQDGEHPDGILGATEFQSMYGTPPALHEVEVEAWFALD